MRRLHTLVISLIAAHSVAWAEPPSPPDDKGGRVSREIALDNLLSERESPEALAAVIEVARKSGIGEQAILEARFLYHVDRREDEIIASLLPEFLKQREVFKLEDSEIFGVKEDWLAVIEYVQAIALLGKGDKVGFKHHITEAFWLSPRQAAAFAPHIERMRLEESMRSVKVDFASRFTTLNPGDPVGLQEIMKGKKALLLHFWSPWSRECEASLPDFVKTSAALAANDVAVVSLLPDDAPKQLTDARAMVGLLGDGAAGQWLVDSKEAALAREFRVQNLPTMVVVSPAGEVLFNGDPTDEEFWTTLGKIDSQIQRPESQWEKSE